MFYLQAFLEGNLEEAALGLGQVGFEKCCVALQTASSNIAVTWNLKQR